MATVEPTRAAAEDWNVPPEFMLFLHFVLDFFTVYQYWLRDKTWRDPDVQLFISQMKSWIYYGMERNWTRPDQL